MLKDEELDISAWKFKSAINPETEYHIFEPKPLKYYDGRVLYRVSANKDNSDPKYAFCVLYGLST